mmetsp:Transcript_31099/g.47630  ORF Transcript_31099/g.47630 Transcript_31099/m.47630 type:complete len:200 (-) Transcript_31099:2386-2985(-)
MYTHEASFAFSLYLEETSLLPYLARYSTNSLTRFLQTLSDPPRKAQTKPSSSNWRIRSSLIAALLGFTVPSSLERWYRRYWVLCVPTQTPSSGLGGYLDGTRQLPCSSLYLRSSSKRWFHDSPRLSRDRMVQVKPNTFKSLIRSSVRGAERRGFSSSGIFIILNCWRCADTHIPRRLFVWYRAGTLQCPCTFLYSMSSS